MATRIIQFGTEPNPIKRLRQEWALSLEEHLDAAEMSRKEFRQRLLEQGCDVSLQAISLWLRGECSPRPYHQAAIAAVLRVPVRRLFPIEAVA